MLPRWHILLGAVFTLIVWLFAPNINPLYLVLIFLASFLIDVDHYANAAYKNRHPSLKKALEYHDDLLKREKKEKAQKIFRKGDFHLFHTVEFHILIGLLSFIWVPFFYIFIGMVFHSLLDLASLLYTGYFYRREYFLFNWLWKKF